MWNNCKGERTGPSFPPCSHLFSGRDLQIPPLEFGSLTMGPPAQGLSAAGLETPFPRFPPAPKSTRDRWGEGGDAQRHLPLSLTSQHPAPVHTRAPGPGRPARARGTRSPAAPQPSRAAGSRQSRPPPPTPRSPPDCCAGEEGGEIRPPGLAQRHYLARAVAPACGRARGHRAAGLGKRSFSMEPQARHSRSGHSSGAATARANAPRLPRRRTPGKALPAAPRVPAAPGERTPRAHGRTPPHTHSHALHTHGVPAPPRCPGTAGSPHRARAPPSSRHPSPSSGVQGPARRGRGSPRPPLPEARPAGVPQHREGSVRPASTPGREEGAAPRLGLAPGVGGWGTPITTTTRPLPPFLQHKRLQSEPPSPCNLTGGSQLLHLRRAWGRGAGEPGGKGSGLRRRDPGRGRLPSQRGTLSAPTALSASNRPAQAPPRPRPPSRPPPAAEAQPVS